MKLSQTLLFGVVWIVISGAVGWFGMSLTDGGGLTAAFGWLLGIVGFGLAGMTLLHIGRLVSCNRRGMRMMREDPEGFADLALGYEAAHQALNAAETELEMVPWDKFVARTKGGWPNRMNTTIYDGHPFSCACGDTHPFSTGGVPVLRELAGMRLVLQCPQTEAVTCVEVTGGLRFWGFKSLFGAHPPGGVE